MFTTFYSTFTRGMLIKNTHKVIMNDISDDQVKYTFPNKNQNNQSSLLDEQFVWAAFTLTYTLVFIFSQTPYVKLTNKEKQALYHSVFVLSGHAARLSKYTKEINGYTTSW